jgi:glutamate-ammonia-ligase adenylyltransferase
MPRAAKKKAKAAAKAETTLASAIAHAPKLSDRAAARVRVTEWLDEVGRSAAGKALSRLLDGAAKTEALILGLADGSPYLWELASSKPARLLALLNSDPDAHLSGLLAKFAKAIDATGDEAEAMRLLRVMKAEAALLIALADIGGVWPVMRATRALTDVADAAIGGAVRFLLRDAVARGKLKPADKSKPEAGSGYIVLAMGKMGAFELNYSSDIDLIVFYDPEAPALADPDDAATLYVRITRGLVKLLQERTADGYVFRVDLRLRPDPGSTQIAVSVGAALDYYGSVGQNWERAALIKARVCAGDVAAGEDVLAQLGPFIWRKYLDFAAVADIEALKRQIHAYRGHQEIAVEGHNIKLGRGGIREVEFFVQTQQLVAGGRHPELRDRGTLAMLAALAAGSVPARARSSMPRTVSCARSNTGCRWWPTIRRTRCRRSVRAWSALCALQVSRIAMPSPRCWSGTCAKCRVTTSGCSSGRRDHPSGSRCRFRGRRTTATRSTSLGPWASANRWRCRRPCGSGLRAHIRRCAANLLAASLPSWSRCCSTDCRAPSIRMRRSTRSISSLAACNGVRGCSRC